MAEELVEMVWAGRTVGGSTVEGRPEVSGNLRKGRLVVGGSH